MKTAGEVHALRQSFMDGACWGLHAPNNAGSARARHAEAEKRYPLPQRPRREKANDVHGRDVVFLVREPGMIHYEYPHATVGDCCGGAFRIENGIFNEAFANVSCLRAMADVMECPTEDDA